MKLAAQVDSFSARFRLDGLAIQGVVKHLLQVLLRGNFDVEYRIRLTLEERDRLRSVSHVLNLLAEYELNVATIRLSAVRLAADSVPSKLLCRGLGFTVCGSGLGAVDLRNDKGSCLLVFCESFDERECAFLMKVPVKEVFVEVKQRVRNLVHVIHQ